MCIYITAVLPAKANVDGIRAALGDPTGYMRPLDNQHVSSRLEPGAGYFRVIQQWCDCNVVLGMHAGPDEPPLDVERDLAKLRKKGWGEAKIARWLDVRERRANLHHEGSEMSARAEIGWWRRLIETALHEGNARWFALLRHFGGDPASEDVVWKREQRIALADVTGDLLLDLEEDVLYRFEALRRRTR